MEGLMVEAIPEPYVSMEFESSDDTQQYYNSYVRVKDFGTCQNQEQKKKWLPENLRGHKNASREMIQFMQLQKKQEKVTGNDSNVQERWKMGYFSVSSTT